MKKQIVGWTQLLSAELGEYVKFFCAFREDDESVTLQLRDEHCDFTNLNVPAAEWTKMLLELVAEDAAR